MYHKGVSVFEPEIILYGRHRYVPWVGIRKLFVSSTLFAEVQMNTIDIRIYHELQKSKFMI